MNRCLGKLAPRHDPRTLRLATYLDEATLPPVPASRDWSTAVRATEWGMDGNDKLGDCTCAAAGHMILCWTANAGDAVSPSTAEVELAYWETGDPPASTGTAGGPTDTGRVEIDVLNYWRKVGIGGDKIAAYAAVNVSNEQHVQAAVDLFGGVYIGLALPLTAQNQVGQVWDFVPGSGAAGKPGSWGGHAVPVVAYDAAGLTVVTWGALQRMTWTFWARYTDEAYAVLAADWLGKNGQAPSGFNLAALQQDLEAVTA